VERGNPGIVNMSSSLSREMLAFHIPEERTRKGRRGRRGKEIMAGGEEGIAG
jgi:hypothetical protein